MRIDRVTRVFNTGVGISRVLLEFLADVEIPRVLLGFCWVWEYLRFY